jgi:dUTP pyrophosphatase
MKMSLDEMRNKALLILDPDSGYSQEDFIEEFNKNYSDEHSFDNNQYKLSLEFVNESNNPDPEYATDGSSGFDLRANLTETIKLSPQGGFAIIPTGLYFKIPDNFEIQVRSRSGLAAKNQVAVLNSPGTIDADYRGEIKVILINHGKEDFIINHGDRIAQGVLASVTAKNIVNLNRVNSINTDTERGSGGFGSTGIQ